MPYRQCALFLLLSVTLAFGRSNSPQQQEVFAPLTGPLSRAGTPSFN